MNLGIPAFAKTITPPLSMLPTMMAAMGIHLPATVMGQVINRWLILPAIDLMMRPVPEAWFFVSHLLYGLIVGLGIAMIASREGMLGTQRGAVAAPSQARP